MQCPRPQADYGSSKSERKKKIPKARPHLLYLHWKSLWLKTRSGNIHRVNYTTILREKMKVHQQITNKLVGKKLKYWKEGHTLVLSWCLISWSSFPWNVNLGNYSSRSVIWLEVFAWHVKNLNYFSTLFHVTDFGTQVLQMVNVIESSMRFATWSLDLYKQLKGWPEG